VCTSSKEGKTILSKAIEREKEQETAVNDISTKDILFLFCCAFAFSFDIYKNEEKKMKTLKKS